MQEVVFCYSYEELPRVAPERCKREKFYYFKYEQPPQAEEVEIGPESFVARDKDARGRPEPLLISENLREILLPCDHIQPYVLRRLSNAKETICIDEIFRSSEEKIDWLIAEFQKEGRFGRTGTECTIGC